MMKSKNSLILAVNGTLMRGLELENNLKAVNAIFIKESKTEKAYRLFSIDDKYPAMVKDAKGSAIDVELYEISEQGMQEVLSKEPEGLTFIIENRKEITKYGGWRNYLASKEK